MRQRCQAAPGRVTAVAATRPAWAFRGDEFHPGQTPGGEVAEERQPAGPVLGGGDLQAEDLAVPVPVDAGGDQHGDVDHPAALTDFHRQGIAGHERVGASIQRPGTELSNMLIQVAGHHRNLRLRQRRDAEGVDKFLHPPGRNAKKVTGRHHHRQGPFGPTAPLQ